MQQGAFKEALPILESVIHDDPDDWNSIYLAGQCWRFLGNTSKAINLLKSSLSLHNKDSSVWLALGIAQQLEDKYPDAISSLKRAIDLDPDSAVAYNSLALTSKKNNEPKVAKDVYEGGIKALSRSIAKKLVNNKNNTIFNHANLDAYLWTEYAMFGAIYICSLDETVKSMGWLKGDMAIKEETEQTHGGLYWEDKKDNNGEKIRLFLPNYFNTFVRALLADQLYANLTGNRGVVLEELGENEDAMKHFSEADTFMEQG